MLTTDDYLEAASVAAPLFGLAASSISLLSHSENVVCQLTMSDGTRAALRIHRPGYNSLAELRSEVHWVTSLGDFGMSQCRQHSAPTRATTMCRYLLADMRTTSASSTGCRASHSAVRQVSTAPRSFSTMAGSASSQPRCERITQGGYHPLVSLADGLGSRRGWSDPRRFGGDSGRSTALSDAQRRLFSACRDQLMLDFTNMSFSPGEFGMIHSDLHLGNLMADGDSLTMIDFDDAGFRLVRS